MEQEPKLSEVGQKAKDLLDILDSSLVDASSLIQDNKLIFIVDNKIYRVRMPNQKEKTIAEDKKNKLYMNLLQEGTYKSKNQLRKILKENQDIDISALEIKKESIFSEIKDLYLILAETPSSNITKINSLKQDLQTKRLLQLNVSLEIANYLSCSIEDRLEKEYIEYLTSVCTEKVNPEQEDSWLPMWNSFDEFQVDNTKISTKAIESLVKLMVNMRD